MGPLEYSLDFAVVSPICLANRSAVRLLMLLVALPSNRHPECAEPRCFWLVVLFVSRAGVEGNTESKRTLLPKARKSIWVCIMNVLNLKYERRVHNSAKVPPLQAFGKFSVFPPYGLG